MTKRFESGDAPGEQPVVPTRRPWRAPEFYVMDVGSTEIGKVTNVDNPGQPMPQHS
jgi:predicted Fe-Mo cluster-binding NifX family protein